MITIGTASLFDFLSRLSVKKSEGSLNHFTSMKSVYVAFPILSGGLNILRGRFPDMEMWDGKETCPHSVLVEKAPQFKALVTSMRDPVDAEVLSNKNIVIVSQCAAGLDNIDMEAATNNGIIVANTSEALKETVADLAWTLLMGVSRKVPKYISIVKSGKWKSILSNQIMSSDINGMTLGIIGPGRIGQSIARRGFGFNMKVLYNGPHHKPELEQTGAEYRDLDALLSESDFVVIACGLTKDTFHLINAEKLSHMKKTAFLINIARGGIVDTNALVEALRGNVIAGAGLDVIEGEPIGADHPILSFDNCIVLPHVGSATEATRQKMSIMCANSVIEALEGRKVTCAANKPKPK